MRFTERELTVALTGAAKDVVGAQDKDVRKGRRTADEVWEGLTKFQRFQALDGLGEQLLPVLVSLPDQEVAVGTRPTYTDAEVRTAIEEVGGDAVRGLRGKVVVQARVALVQLALSHVPPRADPDALIVPDFI